MTQLIPIVPNKRKEVGALLAAYLDTLAVAQNRATFYNTQDEARRSTDAIHQAVYALNRGLYLAMTLLPGTQDFAMQQAILRALADSRYNGHSVLTPELEALVLGRLAAALPVQRQLKMFVAVPTAEERKIDSLFSLKANKVNNARSRKLILRTILGHDNLAWIVVKYHNKVRDALSHAWGVKKTGVIRAILAKPTWAEHERTFMRKNVARFFPAGETGAVHSNLRFEAVSFVLGNEGYFVEHEPVGEISFATVTGWRPFATEILRAYIDAPHNFEALSKLPPEVAEGFRAKYHPGRTVAAVLEVTKDKATAKQGMRMQAAAQKRGVTLTFNPEAMSAAELYVYAYERGLSSEILETLRRKAEKQAEGWPMSYERVGVVVDASYGMRGDETQKWRPIAAALAVRDVLLATGRAGMTYFAGGKHGAGLMMPEGATDLAPALLDALEDNNDAVYIISDGYENAPAGRVAEVMALVRQAGITTPVFQVNPVFGAESFGARELAPNLVPVMALQNPVASTLAAAKQALLSGDLETGVRHLLKMTVPQALPEGEQAARPQLVAVTGDDRVAA